MKGIISSIESMGLVDGPGIRTVIFLGGCKLRCKYCHNPEMQSMVGDEFTVEELVSKILRNKPYFKNNGGVTFSGGEPLLQIDFLIEVCKVLKKEGIHIVLDTAGVGVGRYKEILDLVDLVLLDIKHTDKDNYFSITSYNIDEVEKFITYLNRSNTPVWIRQVVIPSINDNDDYLDSLVNYLSKIKNIEKIEFLPFHHLGFSKYEKLGIKNYYKDIDEMNKDVCDKLYIKFMEKYKNC